MNLFKLLTYVISIYFIFCDDIIIDNNEEKINNELLFIQKLQSIIDEVEIEYKFKETLTDEEKKLFEKLIEGNEDINSIENMTCEECQKEKKQFEEKCNQNENICEIDEDVCKEFCKE